MGCCSLAAGRAPGVLLLAAGRAPGRARAVLLLEAQSDRCSCGCWCCPYWCLVVEWTHVGARDACCHPLYRVARAQTVMYCAAHSLHSHTVIVRSESLLRSLARVLGWRVPASRRASVLCAHMLSTAQPTPKSKLRLHHCPVRLPPHLVCRLLPICARTRAPSARRDSCARLLGRRLRLLDRRLCGARRRLGRRKRPKLAARPR